MSRNTTPLVCRVTGRRAAIRHLLGLPLACLSPAMLTAAAQNATGSQKETGWTPLFNGTSFDGWETFLGRPHRSSDVPGTRDEKGEYVEPLGVSRDPKNVFSIVSLDGGPVIRVSGEIYGALTTVAEHGDYHLRFDFRWGSLTWPQRGQLPRDTGCCYHAVGPHGASYGYWMQSCEFQIMEGHCGDFYGLAGVMVDVDGVLQDPANPKSDAFYRPGSGPIRDHTRRVVKRADHERPRGEWNTLDLYCSGQQSLHVVNGRPVMKVSGIRQRRGAGDGNGEAPLQRGRIQLQSEGGEVFFRKLSIRSIHALPNL